MFYLRIKIRGRTIRVATLSEFAGDWRAAIRCEEAATARVIERRTRGLLRMLSGVNSDGWTGSSSEGNSCPDSLQTSTMLSIEDTMISRRDKRSLVIMESRVKMQFEAKEELVFYTIIVRDRLPMKLFKIDMPSGQVSFMEDCIHI